MKLSRREREVAELVAEGLTNRDIAQRLFVSERTAEYHVEQIRNKLGFRNRTQIAAWVQSNPEPPAAPGHQHNLPPQLTSFVGRREEIGELERLVDQNRTVTISGPPGIGKTRLAQEVAVQLLPRFADGVWLVQLAELKDPQLIPEVLLTAVALPGVKSQPARDAVLTSLRTRRMLVIFDSCERVLDAVAAQCDALLRACPDIRILATSQEPLRVPGEVVWRLGGLEEAEALFCERASLVSPDAPPSAFVSEICTLLDGLPLAIELAASQLGVMSPADLRAGLTTHLLRASGSRTTDPRHRSLRAAMSWTFELLTPEEQLLFRRLAIFAGGFRLETAAAVCGDDPAQTAALILSLADKSLLVHTADPDGRTRYRMLEAMRQFGLERLDQSGELEKFEALHFYRMLDVAESNLAIGPGAAQSPAVARLATEIDNFREALDWGRAHDPDGLLRMANALAFFWQMRHTLVEARGWLETALAGSTARGKLRADVLWQTAMVAAVQGDLEHAQAHNREAAEIYEDIADWGQLARVLNNMAFATKDSDLRRPLLERGLETARRSGDPTVLGLLLSSLALVARDDGDLASARELAEESLVLRRAGGSEWAITRSLLLQANLALDLGEPGVALPAIREALTIVGRLGDQDGLAMSLAALARQSEEPATALRLAAAAHALLKALGTDYVGPLLAATDEHVALFRAELGPRAAAIEAETREMSFDGLFALAQETADRE